MAKITYPNKLIGDQFKASEANEIKSSVNALYDEQPSESTIDEVYNGYFINGYGDSLTLGGYDSYGTILSRIAGIRFYNFGVSGENSTGIKNRFISNPDNKKYPFIIWAGRNGFANTAVNVSDIAEMVAYSGHDRYLIFSVTNGGDEPIGSANYNSIQTLNNSLYSAYGVRFVDVRSALVAAYNPSIPQDVIDHNNDVPPSSLRADNIHFNSAGYEVVSSTANAKINLLQPDIDKKYLSPDDLSEIFKNPPSIGGGGTLLNDGFLRRIFLNKTNTTSVTDEKLWVEGRSYFNGNTNISGNLSIGTPSGAGYKLEVTGTVKFTGITNADQFISIRDDASFIGQDSTATQIGMLQFNKFTGAFISTQTTGHNIRFIPAGVEALRIFATNGNVVIQNGGTFSNDNTNRLQVSGSIKSDQYRISALNTAPASSTATGTTGEIRYTATHIYVCIATNTWVRAALATW